MEEGKSILESIFEEVDLGDVEMLDVEEGELVDNELVDDREKRGVDDFNGENQGSQSKNKKRKGNKKKNKKKKGGSGPKALDINRFVLDTCRRLKEKKSYLVYTAVGCLGISALSDLVREVDAIQSCGGQMTADGRRYRNGGGILWNIIKAREPVAYREIMKKAKDFEKQFKQQNIRQAPPQSKQSSSQETASTLANETATSVPEDSGTTTHNPAEEFSAEGARKSVHDRIRVPVSYEDLPGEDMKDI
ncbi:hypothetical protein F3Y22_tig00110557pilonHSYRG00321 [Hibiscus syriacus]|uniref:Phosphorylated adapter RNA export protein n=1 Tax=Hibiscus syriacus TaxID=106335 RepID=A0A6A3A9I4_HIBSY|nr:uncharacterized protein LOC120132006 [Hibiscus syriacus]KAE8700397.1 hypothetical protein F3Y22_tig00110557pilonHSYRG00321 [Hibiscus syriacus]